jgi:hypothetical protein
MDGIPLCDREPGLTADAQIKNAIAALPAAGGVIDCRGYRGTSPTIATPITIGNVATGQVVTMLMDKATNFQVSVVGNVDAITLANSAIVAIGAEQPTGERILPRRIRQSCVL